MSSQLIINSLASEPIAASPSGLVRSSGTVTCTVTTGAGGFHAPVGTIGGVSVSEFCPVVVLGSTAVNGNSFNGTFALATVNGGQTVFTWLQTGANDTGGGGTLFQLPGFLDLPDSLLAGNEPFYSAAALAMSRNGKFSSVRCEIISMGFYSSGNVIPTPTSPVDGYQYSRPECIFFSTPYSSRQPDGTFVPGQLTAPSLANLDLGAGNILEVPEVNYVQRATGVLVLFYVFAGNGAQAQGTAQVWAVGQRLSIQA